VTAVPIRLLLLEDNAGDARLVQEALADGAPGEFVITWVERLADALARIRTEGFDAVLSDLGLPDSTGLATAQAIAVGAPALALVVLTGSHDQDLGREAIQHGAQDYLVKGEASGPVIARTLRYAIERKRLEIGLRTANEVLKAQERFDAEAVSLLAERASKAPAKKPKAVRVKKATPVPANDAGETLAIKKLFGERAYSVPISSTKSMIGHPMGAAGALETIACALTIQHGIIHPTINYDNPDPDCDLDYVPNQARRAEVRVILKNSFGFGGQNASLVFRRFED